MVAPTEWEKSFNPRNGGPTWPEDRLLSPFVQKRREKWAHPVPTKAFLQLNPEAAMLSGQVLKPLVLPFLLAQNLSPKDIARSDITSWKLYNTYIRLERRIG